MDDPEVKYAGLLRQKSVSYIDAGGGLAEWSRVLDRARRLIAQGRKREALDILKEIAAAVNAARQVAAVVEREEEGSDG